MIAAAAYALFASALAFAGWSLAESIREIIPLMRRAIEEENERRGS